MTYKVGVGELVQTLQQVVMVTEQSGDGGTDAACSEY